MMMFFAAHIAHAAPVLKESQPAGTIITADMLTDKNIGSRSRTHFVMDADAAIGLALKQRVGAGVFLRESVLQQPLDIRRGDVVSISYKKPGLSVVTDGRALSGGYTGDWIDVMSLSSRSKMQARITKSGAVEVH